MLNKVQQKMKKMILNFPALREIPVLSKKVFMRCPRIIYGWTGIGVWLCFVASDLCAVSPVGIWRYEGEAFLVPAKKSVSIPVPSLDIPDGQVAVLVIQARLQQGAGYGNYLQLAVNGKPVDDRVGEERFGGGLRILNKSKSAYGDTGAAFFDGNNLLTIFSYSFENIGEDSTYMLDVSDLIHKDRPNEITITNMAAPEYFNMPGDSPQPELLVGRLELSSVPASQAAASPLRKSEIPPHPIAGGGIRFDRVEVLASPSGGLEIRNQDTSYFIESEFSRPGGGKHLFAVDEQPVTWRKLEVHSPDPKTISILAEDESYQLTRSISFQNGRLEMHDTFTNLLDRVIGVAITNTMIPSRPPQGVYLGGIDGVVNNGSPTYPAANPTVFYAFGDNGLGIAAEDTVLRLGLKTYRVGAKCYFLAHHFGLEPLASYTLRWAIYPENQPSYWPFISRLRRDWGANRTVDNFGFAATSLDETYSDEAIRTFFQRRGIRITIPGLWWGQMYGFNGTPQEQVKILRKDPIRIKRACPDMRVLCKIQPLLSAACPEGQDPYQDSQIIREDGQPMTFPCDPRDPCYGDVPQGWVRYRHVPVIGNSWYRQLEQWIQLSMTEGGFDGIYFDTFSYATGFYGRYTYDRWDGHTVDVDPETGEVTRKYADLAIISEPARIALIEQVRKYGGEVLANDPPQTEGMTRINILRCNETTNHQGYAQMHLSTLTPLGHSECYTSNERRNQKGWKTETDRMDDILDKLSAGCLYSYYYAGPELSQKIVTNWMFPITPAEIGPGWVIGEERIVTMVSGAWGWGPDTVGETLLFDKNGHRIPVPLPDAIQTVKEGVKIQIPDGGIGILIRKIQK